jgi:hypothetical protein
MSLLNTRKNEELRPKPFECEYVFTAEGQAENPSSLVI